MRLNGIYFAVVFSGAVLAGAAAAGVMVMAPEPAPVASVASPTEIQDPAVRIQNERNMEQLVKEYREAPSYLPPLPDGTPDRLDEVIANFTYAPDDSSDPDRDEGEVFVPGFFRSIFAMHWQCAWAKEAVDAQKAGDFDKVEEAIAILESFSDSELASSFPTYDRKLAMMVYPIRDNDFDGYYDLCKRKTE